ncbi:aminopeptidase [bacterium]|nr:aminopeptidase [bacterium]
MFSKNTLSQLAVLIGLISTTTACQLGYYAHTGYNQGKLLLGRTKIEKALQSGNLNEDQKRKLLVAREAKNFAQDQLGLKSNGNYESFVSLDRDAVTYVVQVAYADQLKSYKWRFPFIGAVPYKGYFNPEAAKKEADQFPETEYDTWVRGVRAYSTLGWFKDPITSPMLSYNEHDLAEVIIHELTHTTIYIKDAPEFNERLATFIGTEGTVQFYRIKEGEESPTGKRIKEEQEDLRKFSTFISKELKDLRAWYGSHEKDKIRKEKQERIREIQKRFSTQLKPELKTNIFDGFPKLKLNNARLLGYETYVSDLSEFQRLFLACNKDLRVFIEKIKSLKDSSNPEADLARLASSFRL